MAAFFLITCRLSFSIFDKNYSKASVNVIGVFVHECEVFKMDFLISHPVVKVRYITVEYDDDYDDDDDDDDDYDDDDDDDYGDDDDDDDDVVDDDDDDDDDPI